MRNLLTCRLPVYLLAGLLALLLVGAFDVTTARAESLQLSALPVAGDNTLYFPYIPQCGTIIRVNTVEDELNEDGDCSLREAVQAANLERAVDACPAGTGVDLIRLPVGEYILTHYGSKEDGNASGDLDLWSTLKIEGADREQTVLGGEYSDRVVEIHPGAHAAIERVAIQNGWAPHSPFTSTVDDCGGGVLNTGHLTLRQAVVRWNTTADGTPNDLFYCGDAEDGGGICNRAGGRLQVLDTLVYENATGNGGFGCGRRQGSGGSGAGILNDGEASIVLSTIFGNVAGRGFAGGVGGSGGGIFNAGSLDVMSTTVRSNWSGDGVSAPMVGYLGGAGDGAGLANDYAARLTIAASSIYSNVTGVDGGEERAGGSGGGIHNSGALTMTNSTVSGNQASQNGGGGIYTEADMVIASSTIASNTAATQGGGATIYSGYLNNVNLKLRNVLVAGNSAGVDSPDCHGTLKSFGYNLLGADAGCTIDGDAEGNLYNQPAHVQPLGDWGGPTWTHDLSAIAPALNTGSCTDLAGQPIPADQRGVARPQGTSCDIGAVEHSP